MEITGMFTEWNLYGELYLFTIPILVLLGGFLLSFMIQFGKNIVTMYISTIDINIGNKLCTAIQEISIPTLHLNDNEKLKTTSDDPDDDDNETIMEMPLDMCFPLSAVETCIPESRIGSIAYFDSFAGIFIVAGGMIDNQVNGDIMIYSIDNKCWEQYNIHNQYGFLYGYLGLLKDSLITFGGLGLNNLPQDDVRIFNFEDSTWDIVPICTLNRPSPRFNGSTSIFNDSMILFGGRDMNKCYNDVWNLSFKDGKGYWSLLNITSEEYIAEEREAHSSVILHDKLFIFGGNNVYGDYINVGGHFLEVFDLTNQKWSLIETMGDGPDIISSGGTAVAIPSSNKIVIISGQESDCSFFNGIYVLDLSNMFYSQHQQQQQTISSITWIKYGVDWCGDISMPPDSRLYFCSAFDECDSIIYIFGGQQLTFQTEYSIPELQNEVLMLDVSSISIKNNDTFTTTTTTTNIESTQYESSTFPETNFVNNIDNNNVVNNKDHHTDNSEDQHDDNNNEDQHADNSENHYENTFHISEMNDPNYYTRINNVEFGNLFTGLHDSIIDDIDTIQRETLDSFTMKQRQIDNAFSRKYRHLNDDLINDLDTLERTTEMFSTCPLPIPK
jgi:hypothetical protein